MENHLFHLFIQDGKDDQLLELEFSKHGAVARHRAVCLPRMWQTECFIRRLSKCFSNGFTFPNGFSQMDSGDKSDKRGNGFIWRVRSEHDVNEICAAILSLAIPRCRQPSVSSRAPPTRAGKLVLHRLLMALRLPRLCLKVKRQHLALSLVSFIDARRSRLDVVDGAC